MENGGNGEGFAATEKRKFLFFKNGYLYTRELDEEEGMEYVKRYKIKNWEQIKKGR